MTTQFDDFDIFEFEPQRKRLRQGWTFTPEEVSGHGGSRFIPLEQYPAWRSTWTYIIEGRDTLTTLTDFFDVHKGKLFPFWCPSWGSAYEINSAFNFIEGGTSLLVDKYSSIVYDGDLRSRLPSRLRLRVRDSASTTYFTTHVIAFDNLSQPTFDILVIDTPYDSGLNLIEEDAVIDFMYFVRFDVDTLTVKSLARDVFEVRLPMVEVPHETPGLTQFI